MKRNGIWLLASFTIALAGCSRGIEQYTLPNQVSDFASLYEGNCAGCHGSDGRSGAARPLNDPVFLALIGKEKLRDTIAMGVPQTPMPAFALDAGGTLTNRQIGILADQMEARWSRPQDLAGATLPPYSAEPGDVKHGEVVFHSYCASCHGEDGTGGAKGGSVISPAFLALVSDQSLRTTVIAGRTDLAVPDWRSDSPGRPMMPQEISDVVAWISAHRATTGNPEKGGTSLP